jgi:hypothetical protein
VFELGYFWRMSPDYMFEMPLTKLELYDAQAERIYKLREGPGDGG